MILSSTLLVYFEIIIHVCRLGINKEEKNWSKREEERKEREKEGKGKRKRERKRGRKEGR